MRIKAAALVCTALGTAVAAQAAPAELLGKSVLVSFTTTIPARGPGGMVAPRVLDSSYVIYISSAGRIFSRVSHASQMASRTMDLEPGSANNTFRFEGGKLIGVKVHVGGAAQMVVTFDPGGRGCNATFISGRENGGAYRFRGPGGMLFEATGPVSHTNVSCSVANGNALAE